MTRTLMGAAILSATLFAGVIQSQSDGIGRADLALIPGDAVAFVHIRAADLWKTEPLKEVRELFERAGPRARETYNRRFPINPSLIDRVTVFVLPGPADDPQRMPPPLFAVSTTKPVDGVKLVAGFLPGAKAQTINGAAVFSDDDRDVALYPVNPQTFVVSTMESIKAYISGKKTGEGALKATIADAGSKHVTFGFNASAIPPEAIQQAPPPFQPLLKLQRAVVTLDVNTELVFDARLHYADAAAAEEAEKAARAALQMAREQMGRAKSDIGRPLFAPNTPAPAPLTELPEAMGSLFGLALVGQYDEMLANFPIARQGSQLVVQAKAPAQSAPMLPAMIAAVGWLGYMRSVDMPMQARPVSVPLAAPIPLDPPPPPPGRLFESKEGRTINNLKQIGLAFHNYHDAMGTMPPHAIYSKDGKPLLSWRVAILPYLEQDALYRQFKLDEPWDSEHNKKLLATIPTQYQNFNAPPTRTIGNTHFKVFVGSDAGFERRAKGIRFPDVTDGLSNTIMVVDAADSVPWTRPDDIDYDPKRPLPKLGANPEAETALFLMMDGSVHKKPKNPAEAKLRAAITRRGGEILEW